MQEYDTDLLLNLLSSLGWLGLEPSPWCSTPRPRWAPWRFVRCRGRCEKQPENRKLMPPCKPYALLKFLGNRWPAFSAGNKRPAQVEDPLADSASWKSTCGFWKDSHGLPTNKLLGSTDVEGEAHPSFSKEVFNHLLTLWVESIILYGLEQLRLGSGFLWLFGVVVLR